MTAAAVPAPPSAPQESPLVRAAAMAVMFVLLLSLAAVVGQQLQPLVGSRTRFFLQGVVLSGLLLPAVWWMRSRRDGLSVASLGAPMEWRSLTRFVAGMSILVTPVLLVSTLGPLFGWVTVTLDGSGTAMQRLAVAIATAFLFEALPEELVFRGYVYRTLASTRARWVASVLTLVLFVAMPVLSAPLQQLLLGGISIGGNDRITMEYVVMLLLFGGFLQYLRVLSGSIWAGMGFHLAFLLLNRVVGPRETHLVRLSDVTASGPMQMLALGSFLAIFVGLLAWPRVKKRPLGWNQPEPETSAG